MNATPSHILILTADKNELSGLQKVLKLSSHVFPAKTIKNAWEILYKNSINIILVDQNLGANNCINFLLQVRNKYSDIIRLLSVDKNAIVEIFDQISAIGVYQIIPKPWQVNNVKIILENSLKIFEFQKNKDLQALDYQVNSKTMSKVVDSNNLNLNSNKKQKNTYLGFNQIIRHRASPLNGLCKKIKKFAEFEIPILITGESGTGKELFAQAIHYNSKRYKKPMMVMNCAAMPDELLESELFGYKKGAFTGAYYDKAGLLEDADGGIVFLDEIGDISLAFQMKLLRVLQDNVIRRLGDNITRRINVRFIAATNKNIANEIKLGNFREDLFFRISSVSFLIPPLRERGKDIQEIINHTIKQINKSFGINIKKIDKLAMKFLLNYSWPGNVRELQNELQQAAIMANNSIITTNELNGKIKGE